MPERLFPAKDIVPLNVQSEYSLLTASDYNPYKRGVVAVTHVEDIIKTAKKYGYTRIAISDSNLYSMGRNFQATEEQNLQPIIGRRYQLLDLGYNKDPISSIIFPRNDRGLQTLFEIETKLMRDGKPSQPDDLLKNSDLTVVLLNESDTARELIEKNNNAYYGIDFPSADNTSNIKKIQNDTQKVVAAFPVRLTDKNQLHAFSFFAEQVYKDQTIDPYRLEKYVLRPPMGYTPNYQQVLFALANTKELAEDIRIQKPEVANLRPKSVPEGVSVEDHFRSLVQQAIKEKQVEADLLPRIEHEIEGFINSGFVPTLLVTLEETQFARKNKIYYSVTGSANNSVVLNFLGLISIDARDKDFDRFISIYRNDLPDIDIRYAPSKDDLIFDWYAKNYPDFSRMAVVKRMGIESIRKLLSEKGKDLTLTERRSASMQLAKLRPVYQRAIHPSGLMLFHNSPKDKINTVPFTQLDKTDVDNNLRFPKRDILHARSLGQIQETLDILEEQGSPLKDIPLNDGKALKRLFSSRTTGFSTIESPHLQNILEEVGKRLKRQPTLQDIAHVLAVARPNHIIKKAYYNSLVQKENLFKNYQELIDILAVSDFTIMYQEQVTAIAKLAGLAPKNADKVRKIMGGQSNKEEQEALLSQIEKGLTGVFQKPVVSEIKKQIESFRSFGFVQGHAEALALEAYTQSYLAEHYPKQFWLATTRVMVKNPQMLFYSPQIYINEMLKDCVTFTFPPLENFKDSIEEMDGSIAVNKDLLKTFSSVLGKGLGAAVSYSDFQRLLNNPETSKKDIIRYQLALFGVSFTHNPIDIFPKETHFNPGNNSQIIYAYPVLQRQTENGYSYVSLSSGELVHTKLTDSLYERNKKQLQNSVLRVHLYKESDKWSIANVLPLYQTEIIFP